MDYEPALDQRKKPAKKKWATMRVMPSASQTRSQRTVAGCIAIFVGGVMMLFAVPGTIQLWLYIIRRGWVTGYTANLDLWLFSTAFSTGGLALAGFGIWEVVNSRRTPPRDST